MNGSYGIVKYRLSQKWNYVLFIRSRIDSKVRKRKPFNFFSLLIVMPFLILGFPFLIDAFDTLVFEE
jgi:hypothetical protein